MGVLGLLHSSSGRLRGCFTNGHSIRELIPHVISRCRCVQFGTVNRALASRDQKLCKRVLSVSFREGFLRSPVDVSDRFLLFCCSPFPSIMHVAFFIYFNTWDFGDGALAFRWLVMTVVV
jgi:hypothetical protein